ncbi:alpha-galactosidase [Runella sp.]|uniref:alpha-galactosidase n=1 Tax=Runella sp. TaxID=1960881 RepID=UPI003D0C4CA2
MTFAQKKVVIPIETDQNSLVLSTDRANRLRIGHFGKRLQQAVDYESIPDYSARDDDQNGMSNSAYTSSGSTNLFEPAFAVTHADGNMSTELKYVSHTVTKQDANVTVTSIVLKDDVYPVEVTLFYKTYAKENVVEQWSVIKNNEGKAITLEKYASANLYFKADNYYLTHYHGNWAREMKPEHTLLTAGIKSIDSKLGTRANLFEPPTFMVSFDRASTEDEGNVLLGQLAWSGNFKIDFELDAIHNLRLIAGINPYASAYSLAPAKSFVTPSFIFTFSDKGKGDASRNLHRWARKYRILDGNGSRLTLLNNWEATYFDFDETKLTALFADAKKLGVDLFLLDDGWFGNKYPRNNDRAGLGDWQENVKKLPNGLGYLVKETKNAGVKFGIWLEPEMVNPKSELYEKHPDWVIKEPKRPEHYFRNQLVLDLANPEVQNFVFGILDNMFTKNPEIGFIKWDCNAVIYNAHSAYLEKTGQKQSQLYVDYVKGLYKVLERIRAKYPTVPMMLCSGGGGRVDYGALNYFTEFWLSDNTDPLERVFIQWENSYFYPAIAHCNHVTDWSKVSMKYRTDVAMMGKMGFDIVVSKLEEKELKSAQNSIAAYNNVKDVIWHGDLFRLVNPFDHPFAALMFVNEAKDHAVQFNYLVTNRYDQGFTTSPIRLKGLDSTKKYKIKEINLYPDTRTPVNENLTYSGDYLMNIGFNPILTSNRKSVVLEITAVQ